MAATFKVTARYICGRCESRWTREVNATINETMTMGLPRLIRVPACPGCLDE